MNGKLATVLSVSLVGEESPVYLFGYVDGEFHWREAASGKTVDEMFGEDNIQDVVTLWVANHV